MSEHPNSGAAQLRADVPEAIEQEAVRITIVGGRPPGSGQPLGPVPRGIEVLLKKAVVDPEFRKLLLDDPNKAATSIELKLEPVESAMLQTFPKEQLTAIIDKTEVPPMQRRAFLGHVATLMLAALGGVTLSGCEQQVKGVRPDEMPHTAGISPDFPREDVVVEQQIGDNNTFNIKQSRGDSTESFSCVLYVKIRQKDNQAFEKRYPLCASEIIARVTEILETSTTEERIETDRIIIREKLKRAINEALGTPWVQHVLFTNIVHEVSPSDLPEPFRHQPELPPPPHPKPQEMHIYVGMRTRR